MKKCKLHKKRSKMYVLGVKEALGSRMELRSLFKKMNRSKNEIKGVVTSGQRSTQLNFCLVKRNVKIGVVENAFNPVLRWQRLKKIQAYAVKVTIESRKLVKIYLNKETMS